MTNTVSITEKAYAKVNLTLEILGKRRDGYHNLASVMQTVDLFDTVVITESDDVLVTCDDDEITPEINLATKAAQVLQQKTGVSQGASISIQKNIPVSAGMGGGSTDAAAALRGLNKLWKLGLSLDELTELAADVGSDVPFLIRGGTSLVQGRGEDVTPIAPAKIPKFLILTPEIDLTNHTAKTASVFSHVNESMFTRGNLTHKLAARIRAGGGCPPEFFFNQFGTLAEQLFPGWSEQRDHLMSLGARDVMLCGAGPSMFTVPPSKELGTAWHLLLTTVQRKQAFLVDPIPAVLSEAGS
ncbi:4-(cytidine 5'-diphospho)-2-C-methyl-D-erythritol kinase [Candidatus Lucifugimonas marina]|uniref:4-diphosphocytidyl-2-C-methyl-D-erythritol kinase n=1 Tax=Candidatus Lucifugimonas marina TaxID=3038979 RepID=A0AAJ5ZED3_9CHLR|nr:4-(cytidine 5'-diphospho)-2-C-methyl-D-erythritol kinase [SAR202 cluster bacterium JH702]MDG0868855.1 4-(cytidine 5'-diphospho)-2-C-methyl-D-erythritol kinase [SAR202 cluster bacterium JH639]WFG35483.1 4-(cytidine 5'-diphospho)-2-C-methyl-D-erythritol kinase [SAR202 cluster bacterium JH545]WFG39430.1 4-(cytidine 5'-diphospho)-2-C-methyl-D-erythritol kinase [SAR202 cluster bacterium JH1073]